MEITERPNRWPWPLVIYGVAIVSGIALGQIWPLPWVKGEPETYLNWLGVVMIVAAVLIDVAALMALRRASTTVLPNKGAKNLVTSGPFAFSRNPIYLANTALMAGLGLAVAQPWLLLLALPAAYAVQKLAIEREEAHLEAQFGQSWKNYTRLVRRWF